MWLIHFVLTACVYILRIYLVVIHLACLSFAVCLCYTRRALIGSGTYSCPDCLLILQWFIPISMSVLVYMLFLVFVRLITLRFDMIHLLPKRARSFSPPPVCRDSSRSFSLCLLSPELPGDRRWRQRVETTGSVWRMLFIVCVSVSPDCVMLQVEVLQSVCLGYLLIFAGSECACIFCQASTPECARGAGSTEDCVVASVAGVSPDRLSNGVNCFQPDLSRCAVRVPCL